jgi:RNA-binding protein YhbY
MTYPGFNEEIMSDLGTCENEPIFHQTLGQNSMARSDIEEIWRFLEHRHMIKINLIF